MAKILHKNIHSHTVCDSIEQKAARCPTGYWLCDYRTFIQKNTMQPLHVLAGMPTC